MRKAIAIALLASVLKVASGGAALAQQANVPAMVTAADLIVVGRAADVQIAPQSASETLVVWVDRVVASAPNPPRRLTVRLALPAPGSGLGAVEPGQYGMFFLRPAGENGVYTAADPYHPSLAAAPAPGRDALSSDALTDVAHELARALAAPAADLVGPNEPPAAQHLYWEAADALETIPYQIAGPELQTIAASDATPARLWAIAVLLYAGDPVEMAARAPDYLASVEADLLEPGPDEGLAAARLAVSIQARVDSPNAAPILAALLGSAAMPVRRAAANALARIATPEVIAPLAKALDDPEQDIRYYAVRGLAQATGAEVPTLAMFYAREAETLAYWRGRAKAGSLAAAAPSYNGACYVGGLGSQDGLKWTFGVGYYECGEPICGDTVDIEITCTKGSFSSPTCPQLPKGATFSPKQATTCESDTVVTLTMPPNSPPGSYNLNVGGVNKSRTCNYAPCEFDFRINGTAPRISCAASSEVCQKDQSLFWFNDVSPQPANYRITLEASPSGAGPYTWRLAGQGAHFSDGTLHTTTADNTVEVVPEAGEDGDPGDAIPVPHVNVTVTTPSGGESKAFPLYLTKPYRIQLFPKDTQDLPDLLQGYRSYLFYSIVDTRGDVLPEPVDVDEGETFVQNDTNPVDNWNAQSTSNCRSLAGCAPSNVVDNIDGALVAVAKPKPTSPGKPLGDEKVIHACGYVVVGNNAKPDQGVQVATLAWQKFRDHGRLCNVKSPPASDQPGDDLPRCPGPEETSCPSD